MCQPNNISVATVLHVAQNVGARHYGAGSALGEPRTTRPNLLSMGMAFNLGRAWQGLAPRTGRRPRIKSIPHLPFCSAGRRGPSHISPRLGKTAACTKHVPASRLRYTKKPVEHQKPKQNNWYTVHTTDVLPSPLAVRVVPCGRATALRRINTALIRQARITPYGARIGRLRGGRSAALMRRGNKSVHPKYSSQSQAQV